MQMYLVMLMIRTRKERKKVLFPKREIYNIDINVKFGNSYLVVTKYGMCLLRSELRPKMTYRLTFLTIQKCVRNVWSAISISITPLGCNIKMFILKIILYT